MAVGLGAAGVDVRARARDAFGWLRANPEWVAIAVILIWGSTLRVRGYLIAPIPLWEDEAAWAIRLIERPLSEHSIRPPGFMAVTKALITVLSPSEVVLRALPWFLGMLALLLAPLLAEHLFRNWAARLLFIAIIALHPAAIDLSKEFKPYSVALCLHVVCLLLTLAYSKSGRLRELGLGLGLATLGVLLSHDTVFVAPVVFGVMGFTALKRARLHVALVLVSAVCALGLLLALRASSFSGAGGEGAEQYWGKKYDVFYVETRGQGSSRLGWTAARHADLAAMVGMRREQWQLPGSDDLGTGVRRADELLWVLLSLVGCGVLVHQHRLRQLVLLVTPLALMTLMNGLGIWPLGAFRTNLFALVYYAALISSAFEWAGLRPLGRGLAPACVLVLVPYLLFARTSHARKDSSVTSQTSITRAAQKLIELQGLQEGEPALLALDAPSCKPWTYYTKYHPNRDRAADLEGRFHAQCGKSAERMGQMMRKALTTANAHVYMLASDPRSMAALRNKLPADLTIEESRFVGKRDAFVARVARRVAE